MNALHRSARAPALAVLLLAVSMLMPALAAQAPPSSPQQGDSPTLALAVALVVAPVPARATASDCKLKYRVDGIGEDAAQAFGSAIQPLRNGIPSQEQCFEPNRGQAESPSAHLRSQL